MAEIQTGDFDDRFDALEGLEVVSLDDLITGAQAGDPEDDMYLTSDQHPEDQDPAEADEAPEPEPYIITELADMPGVLTTIAAREFRSDAVAPFVVVSDIPNSRACDSVEEAIIAHLSPVTARHSGEDGVREALFSEGALMQDRVSNYIEPGMRKAGGLLKAQALILPFDPGSAIAHSGVWGRRFDPEKGFTMPDGVTVVYSGVVRSSKTSTLAQLCIETTYFKSKDWPRNSKTANWDDKHDFLRRTVSKKPVLSEPLGSVSQQEARTAALDTVNMTRRALRLVYRGGPPGAADRA